MDVYITFLLLFTGLIICYGQYCDHSKLRRCREDIRRNFDRRLDDMSTSECRQFREDFDCLLDQTVLCVSRESEREDYGNDLGNAHTILRRLCNRKDGYDRNRCFEKDIVQCEDILPRRTSNADSETCRKYQDFTNCAERIVDNQCSRNDKSYLRSYYMEIARDLPWKCSTSDRPDRPDDRNRNRTNGFEPTCCRNERCDDRNIRARDCREELLRIMDGRSNIPTYGNSHDLCRRAMDAFNCMLWHSYNCESRHQKDIGTLQNGKDYIERKCDTTGDLRRSCFEQMPMKDCDRHLTEESSSPHDITCREYESYVTCMERNLLRCSSQDELLQGIHLVSKVGEKAWTCSKHDTRFTSSYDPTFTYSTGSTQDDIYCESQARGEHRKCMLERDRLDDEARRENNHREKHVKTCCVAYQFRECTRQVVRQICQRERTPVVDNLMGLNMKSRLAECQDVDQATCSASRMLNNAMIIVLAFAILRSIFPQD